jgi:hypothetical protein
MLLGQLQEAIFSADKHNFESLALEIFRYQSENCVVYRQYLQQLQTNLTNINKLEDIPYLPIDFFKYFPITSGSFSPEIIFESSSTSGKGVSKHLVRSVSHYKDSFTSSFEKSFGNHEEFCHLALLPSYLERNSSSLVFQVNHFISNSDYTESGFYLYNLNELADQIATNENRQIPTILWGVTYALMDFASQFPMKLKFTSIIETGGMKGKRKEIVREELHEILKGAFGLGRIQGEYGMTELMSQAYSKSNGIFHCPPWMQVLGREINDPFALSGLQKHVVLNIIDLANIHSCSFIATSDLGRIYDDGTFEVLGRLDNSDTRGCNLMI